MPTAIVSPYGHRTELSVDAANHLDRIAYEDGSAYDFVYTDDGLMTELTDPKRSTFTHSFDSYGRVTGTEDPEGGIWTLESLFQNDGSAIASITSAEGNTVSHTDRNEIGDTYTSLTTYPTGDSTLFRLDTPSLSEQSTTCNMEQNVSYTLDEHSQAKVPETVTMTTPAGLTNTLTLQREYTDDVNTIAKRTTTLTKNGKATVKEEDFETGVTTTTSPEGRVVTQNIDTDTLLPSQVSVTGLTPTTFAYDAKGRLTEAATGGRTQSYTYDSRGNIAAATDAAGRVTGYTYDLLDRVTQISRPDGHTVTFAYDAKGNMEVLTVPTPADHSFAYNGVDKRQSYTTPLNRVTRYAYDKERKLKSVTFPSGKTIEDVYTDGRLTQTVTPEGTTAYAYACMDNVSSVTRGGERIDYGYDGTLVTSINQSGTLNETIGFTYNSDFNVASISYAGTTQNLGYDNDGLLTSIGAFTVTRNAQNGLAGSLTDGTLTLNRTFNGYAEVDAQSSTVGGSSVYGYAVTSRDNTGRITGKEEYLNGITTHWHYTYDSVGRLTEVNKDGTVVESYDYDANGNRIRTTSTLRGIYDQGATYTVEDAIEQVGGNTYVYDEDGWLSSKITGEGTTHYSYGTQGELRSVVKPDGTTIEYVHNVRSIGKSQLLGFFSFGTRGDVGTTAGGVQRTAKKVNGTVTEKYLWLDLTTLLAVYDGNGNLIQRFDYADGRMPPGMEHNGQTYYLAYDHVGSLRAVSDASGTVVKEIDYDSYGNIVGDSNPSFSVPFGFAGGLYDRDTGLVRFGYRDYDAETGKWTAKDPIGFNGGDTNLYGYVLGDPVNLVDLDGLEGEGGSFKNYNYTKPEVHADGKGDPHIHFGKGKGQGSDRNLGTTNKHGDPVHKGDKRIPKKLLEHLKKVFPDFFKTNSIFLLNNLLEYELMELCEKGNMMACKVLDLDGPVCPSEI